MALFSLGLNETIVSLIRRRMLQVWVFSYCYYELNESPISDAKWTKWAKELAELIKKYPKEFKSIRHYEIFEGFTGDTGFDIAQKATPRLISKAYYLLGRLGKE